MLALPGVLLLVGTCACMRLPCVDAFGSSASVAVIDVGNLSATLQLLREPALLRGAPGDSIRQRWTWQHIAKALSSRTLGGPLTVQRDRDGIFPFLSRGALSSLLPPDSPFNHGATTLSIDGAELPSLLRSQPGRNGAPTPWPYYFSGKIMELAAGEPVARHTQGLGYELLEDAVLVQPLVKAASVLRNHGTAAGEMQGASEKSFANHAAQLQGNLWLSSGNASTPLHYDTSMNMFVQLRGRKRFWLLPPAAATTLPMEPVHSPGHRQLAMRTSPHGSPSHDAGHKRCLPQDLEGLSGTSPETVSEQALAAALPASVIEQLQVVELGPGDALWLPAYWLHHTVAISPRGCLSVSLWAESGPHEHLMQLLTADMPAQNAVDPQIRLAWAALLLANVVHALAGDKPGPLRPESSCVAERAITGSRVARVLRLRYLSFSSGASTGWECRNHQRAQSTEDLELVRFAKRAARWLSHQEADCSVQLLNLVQYAERLLPWVLGLRGDTAEHAAETVRSQLPACALCLADLLESAETASPEE